MTRRRPPAALPCKYGAGKSRAVMTGAAEFSAAAEEALGRCFATQAIVLADQFREMQRATGVPEDVIEDFLRSMEIDDESYLTDRQES